MRDIVVSLLLVGFAIICRAKTCSDQSEHCSEWKTSGFCDSSSTYLEFMKEKCAKTCGLCMPTVTECVDDYSMCDGWARDGYCKATSPYRKWMEDSCRKSCGFCVPVPTQFTPPTTTPVPPSPHSEPKTHEVATSPLPDNCKDKSSYCKSYKPYCTNKDYIDYLKVECKRTCRYCWVTTPPPPTTTTAQPYTGSGGRKLQPNCGNKEKSKERIVGGKNALPGSWPWQVSMDWIDNVANPGHLCGGTLITDEWVMTAAHCFVNDKNKDNYWLTLGQHNIKKVSGNEQVYNISQLLIHPNYNPENQDYDMALMKLDGKAHLNDFVRTACLPGENTSFVEGKMCYITGWGLLSEYGKGPAILQQAQVPLVTRHTCQAAYKSRNYQITPRMLCAGYKEGKIDSCEGDSGGPLVCNEKNSQGKDVWFLWGAISWGVGCARKGSYGVLASSKVLRPWIDQVVFNGHA